MRKRKVTLACSTPCHPTPVRNAASPPSTPLKNRIAYPCSPFADTISMAFRTSPGRSPDCLSFVIPSLITFIPLERPAPLSAAATTGNGSPPRAFIRSLIASAARAVFPSSLSMIITAAGLRLSFNTNLFSITSIILGVGRISTPLNGPLPAMTVAGVKKAEDM